MEIKNDTKFQVATMLGEGPDGKQALTIIIKGTYKIQHDKHVKIAEEQLPIAVSDEFYNDDVAGSIRIESDMVPFKPRADIVLIGRAYVPGGQPVSSSIVSLRVGNLTKAIFVYGDRHWFFPSRLILIPIMTKPEPFYVMDIIYERAFGGIDHKGGEWCRENSIGKGFFVKKSKESIHNASLPNLEDPQNLIFSWDDHPRPVGYGFYRRDWMPRARYIGTVDEKWAKERGPRMPEDFRLDFYNGAHPDLQMDGYLKGDEEVELKNLTPEGHSYFRLSGNEPVVTVSKFINPPRSLFESSAEGAIETVPDAGEELQEELVEIEKLPTIEEQVDVKLDTLCLIPDEDRFYQVWRGLYSVTDIEQLAVEVSKISISLGVI